MREHRRESFRKVSGKIPETFRKLSTCENFRKFSITMHLHALPTIKLCKDTPERLAEN